MSVTVNDLIKLLDAEENRYGGATGKPRGLNISVNGNFCGSIESAKLDGYGDGLVTDVTLEIEVPKMKDYYDKEIRAKAIEEFIERIEERLLGVHPDELYCGYTAKGIANICMSIAEQLKEVGE